MGTAIVSETGVPDTGNVLIDSLVWGSKWESTGPVKITVGYYPTVDNYNYYGQYLGQRGLSATELAAIANTVAEFAKYINVDFVLMGADPNEVSDIQFVLSNDQSIGYLGEAAPPGEQGYDPGGNQGFSEVWVYTNNYASRSGTLGKGGYDYITFVHEFGHAMGLAHPHDTGGTASDPSLIFPGVTSPFGSYGDGSLNQGIFTTMSYNDGWPAVVSNGAVGYGYQAGLMALDILALQYIYGARNDAGTDDTNNDGNIDDVYVLPTRNAVGTGYSSIYDTDGVDTISFAGTANCTIDLRAATGLAEAGGGGFVSFGKGVKGGFTIAVGVVVENATGSRGADTLIGNDSDNVLTGNAGKDRMTGGLGADTFVFNSLRDTSAYLSLADIILDFTEGVDRIDVSLLDTNVRLAGVQALLFDFIDVNLFSAAGQIRSLYDALRDMTVLSLNTDTDQAAEAVIALSGVHDLTDSDFIFA